MGSRLRGKPKEAAAAASILALAFVQAGEEAEGQLEDAAGALRRIACDSTGAAMARGPVSSKKDIMS